MHAVEGTAKFIEEARFIDILEIDGRLINWCISLINSSYTEKNVESVRTSTDFGTVIPHIRNSFDFAPY